MDKDLIKLCHYCKKYYYATKPHWMKSSNCDGLKKMMKEFRKQNKLPKWEVWNISIDTKDYMFMPQYNERETFRNFMKLVGKKLKI